MKHVHLLVAFAWAASPAKPSRIETHLTVYVSPPKAINSQSRSSTSTQSAPATDIDLRR